jgi:hypothetical protein
MLYPQAGIKEYIVNSSGPTYLLEMETAICYLFQTPSTVL